MAILIKIKDGISKLAGAVMCAAIAFMCVSLAAAVFIRNFLGMSFDIIVDINRIMFIWTTFAGLIYINGEDRMIRFDLIEQKLSRKWRSILVVVRKAAGLVLYAVMTYAGAQMYEFAKGQFFPTMPTVSLAMIYLPVCIAGILLIVQTIASFAPADTETSKG